MSSSAGYTQIPDVESGVVATSVSTEEAITQRAMQRYPEANAMEATFLGKIDDAMENCKPQIVLPKVKAEDLGDASAASSLESFAKSLVLPTKALIVSLLSGLLVIVLHSPFAAAIFPYYACLLTFLSSVPATKARLLDQATPAIKKVDDTKNSIETIVGQVATKALDVLSDAEAAMYKAIAPIKDKADMATKLETMLRMIDPTIDIPDTTDIEKGFDGFEFMIKGGFDKVNEGVDISRSLPKVFQSLSAFQNYFIYPFLAVCLLLQFVSVYHSSSSAASTTRMLAEAASTIVMGRAGFLDPILLCHHDATGPGLCPVSCRGCGTGDQYLFDASGVHCERYVGPGGGRGIPNHFSSRTPGGSRTKC